MGVGSLVRRILAACAVVALLELDPPPVARSEGAPVVAGAAAALRVGMTLVEASAAEGAVCLDGSSPAYHLHRGAGAGARNWLLQFEGGGWCADVASCVERAATRRGSTRYMSSYEVFSGILSDSASSNPDFYDWNRVKIRYCDGASFGGDSEYRSQTTTLYFRGQRIWKAVLRDLLFKGLATAEKALLSGCSAGGLATFLHCEDFAQSLPATATVKCLSDAGFFLDVPDISGVETIRSYFNSVVSLQGVQKNLNRDCTSSQSDPYLCFFPQHALPHIQTPYFILNTAYDVYQFHHIFVPPTADQQGRWAQCKLNTAACSLKQISVLEGYRNQMLLALKPLEGSSEGGMYINSCFAHCQSELQETWFAPDSPKLQNKTIAEVVGDWYFERGITKEIDCPYPCDNTCHNILISSKQ